MNADTLWQVTTRNDIARDIIAVFASVTRLWRASSGSWTSRSPTWGLPEPTWGLPDQRAASCATAGSVAHQVHRHQHGDAGLRP